jgi:beta-glucanase (GH16 family)
MKKKFLFCGAFFAVFLKLFCQDMPLCNVSIYSQSSYSNICQDNFVWELVFYDEFNGNSLDASKWLVYPYVVRHGDGILYNYYNISIENSYLSLIAKRESPTWVYDVTHKLPEWGVGNEYISYSTAAFNSKYKYGYGKFESSIKIPYSNKLWPAFWLYSGNDADGSYNEIDFFEFMSHNTTRLTITDHHYSCDNRCSSHFDGNDFSLGFHTYSGIWLKDRLEWHVTNDSGDDIYLRHDYPYYDYLQLNGICRLDARPVMMYKDECFPDAPMYILYDIAFYTPNIFDESPKSMQVDYIKYYTPAYCIDKTITDPSPYILSGTDNFICFRNVTILCSLNVPTDARVDVIGKTGVTLGPGFRVNANFSAKNDPSMSCSTPSLKSEIIRDDNSNKDIIKTSIEDIDEKNGLNICPTLTTGKIIVKNLDYKNDYNQIIQVYNIDGNLIINRKVIESTEAIELSNYPNGIYIIKIIQYGKIKTFKIIKD